MRFLEIFPFFQTQNSSRFTAVKYLYQFYCNEGKLHFRTNIILLPRYYVPLFHTHVSAVDLYLASCSLDVIGNAPFFPAFLLDLFSFLSACITAPSSLFWLTVTLPLLRRIIMSSCGCLGNYPRLVAQNAKYLVAGRSFCNWRSV